jgi:hypothetical protein
VDRLGIGPKPAQVEIRRTAPAPALVLGGYKSRSNATNSHQVVNVKTIFSCTTSLSSGCRTASTRSSLEDTPPGPLGPGFR